MLIDTHCHLYSENMKNDLDGILSRANELEVTQFLCVGTNISNSKECLSIAENNDNIFSSAGVHPTMPRTFPMDILMTSMNLWNMKA